MKKLSFFLVVLILTTCKVEKKVLLQLNFKEGKHYGLLMTTDQKISQEIQGQKMELDQTMKIGLDFNVVRVLDNGDAEIEVTYKRTGYRFYNPMIGTFEYDSDNPPAKIPPPALGFAALIGKGFTIVISPKGEVRELRGLDQMLAQVVNDLDLPPQAASAREQIVAALKKQFGDDATKEMLGQTFNIFPPDSIPIGGTWRKRIEMRSVYPMVIDARYTLQSIKENEAHISLSAEIGSNPKTSPLTFGGMTMEYQFSGKMEGELVLDLESGLTKSGRTNQVFSGEMKITGGPSGKPTAVPIKIEGTTRFEPL